jgi:hypothetical protein
VIAMMYCIKSGGVGVGSRDCDDVLHQIRTFEGRLREVSITTTITQMDDRH